MINWLRKKLGIREPRNGRFCDDCESFKRLQPQDITHENFRYYGLETDGDGFIKNGICFTHCRAVQRGAWCEKFKGEQI
jgi:hypothetical protein